MKTIIRMPKSTSETLQFIEGQISQGRKDLSRIIAEIALIENQLNKLEQLLLYVKEREEKHI